MQVAAREWLERTRLQRHFTASTITEGGEGERGRGGGGEGEGERGRGEGEGEGGEGVRRERRGEGRQWSERERTLIVYFIQIPILIAGCPVRHI